MILENIIDKTARFIKSRPGTPLESVDYIIVHHTSRERDHPDWVRFRHIFLRDNGGWDDIGYHYLIGDGKFFTADGKSYKGRDEKYQGAHAYGYNDKSLSVCLIGNLDKNKPTEKQINTLIGFLAEKAAQYNVPAERILGHRELPDAEKSCPGKNVDMDYIRKKVAERLQK